MFRLNPRDKEAVRELFKESYVFRRNYLFVLNTNNEDVSDQIKRDIKKRKHEIIKRRYAWWLNKKNKS